MSRRVVPSLMIYRNVTNPNDHTEICANPRANDVAPDDPNHSIGGVNFESKFCLQHSTTLVSYTLLVFNTFQPDEDLVNSSPAQKYEVMGGYVDCHYQG